jgi:signal transduction histidine kinase
MRALERLGGASWTHVVAPGRHRQTGWLVGTALVAAITGLIELLKPHTSISGLGVLYLLAILPPAVFWGSTVALGISLLSAGALALNVARPADGVALGAFVLTALVVSELSARSSREKRVAERLAGEQAALRRIATLVARGIAPAELFSAVSDEVARLLPADGTFIAHIEPGSAASFVVLAVGGQTTGGLTPGERRRIEAPGPIAAVVRTRCPARTDDFEQASPELRERIRRTGVRSSVVTPIMVEGRLWGAIAASSRRGPFPIDTEQRMLNFTELVATAIANTESRSALARLAEEQAALRRVATLVARGARAEALFAAATGEVGRLLGTGLAGMVRYDSDDSATVVATWAAEDEHGDAHPLVPGPWPLEGGDVASMIWRTGRPVRIDDYHGVAGPIATFVREVLGVVASAASPIVVEGQLWGALFVHSKRTDQPLAGDTESRLTAFTELVATAVANAESRSELAASRARIVAASDNTRRRLERDLHDGAQQRLVSLGLSLRSAQAELPRDLEAVRAELSHVGQGLTAVLDELREISRGIHPAILSEGGLAPALKTLARRSPVPVALDVSVEGRLTDGVEVAAYYIVSEMLTNTAKHAQASAVYVDVARVEEELHIAVRDDGVGGADPARGSGLVGLRDRVEALGGTIAFHSAKGLGTAVEAMLPLTLRGGGEND